MTYTGSGLVTRPRVLALCAAAALAVLAAASASARVDAQKANPFKVMLISGITAPSNTAPEIVPAANAAIKAINASGGLGGRDIELTVCSHQASAAGEAQCARQAVSIGADNIIEYSAFQSASLPITTAAGIPHIGSQAAGPVDYRDPLYFPVGAPIDFWPQGGVLYLLKNKSIKRWAGWNVPSPGGVLEAHLAEYLVKKNGRSWLSNTTIPIGQADYLPLIQKLKDENVQAVVMPAAAGQIVAYKLAKAQLGGTWFDVVNGASVPPASIANFPDHGSQVVLGGLLPAPASSKAPGIATYRKQLAASGAGNDPNNFSQEAVVTWLEFWALRKLADRVKGSVTKEALIAQARKTTVKNPIDLFGLVKWTPGKKGPAAYPDAPDSNVYPLKFSNGAYVDVQKTPFNVYQRLGLTH